VQLQAVHEIEATKAEEAFRQKFDQTTNSISDRILARRLSALSAKGSPHSRARESLLINSRRSSRRNIGTRSSKKSTRADDRRGYTTHQRITRSKQSELRSRSTSSATRPNSKTNWLPPNGTARKRFVRLPSRSRSSTSNGTKASKRAMRSPQQNRTSRRPGTAPRRTGDKGTEQETAEHEPGHRGCAARSR
jgi:hypothetical protein